MALTTSKALSTKAKSHCISLRCKYLPRSARPSLASADPSHDPADQDAPSLARPPNLLLVDLQARTPPGRPSFSFRRSRTMDSLSRLGQRISENINESTRNLTFAGSSRDLFETTEDQRKHILKLLESSHDKEKIEGMKRLIALISKAHPVASFFPNVIKLVSTPTLELRKLVYIYILRHAESEPDLALLCINTFQKDLNDPNPLIRSMAIRVLSGIRVPMVGGVVEMAVKKGAGDPNPYVRRAAALAIPKLYGTNEELHSTLMGILKTLLADSSSIPLGATLMAFQVLYPLEYDLLHPHFRRYCSLLVEADEWTQLALMDVLGRYARLNLRPPPTSDDEEPDEDLVLLLSTSQACLYSPSPAVLLGVTRLHHSLSPPSPTPLLHLAPPLLKLLQHPDSGVRLAVLKSCATLAKERSDVFDDEAEGEDRWKAFLLGGGEAEGEAQAKIGVLRELVGGENVKIILDELAFYVRNASEQISTAAIQALGLCAERQPEVRNQVTSILLKLLNKSRDSIVATSILVLKKLILSQPSDTSTFQSASKLVAQLASRWEVIKSPSARACVLWLVGRHPGEGGLVGLEVLRVGVKDFAQEKPEVKLALLTLATKLLSLPTLQTPAQLPLLARHLFLLARYDESYDVRDRSRFLRGLVRGLLDQGEESAQEEEGGRDVGGVVLRREQIGLVLSGGEDTGSAIQFERGPQAEYGTFSLLTQPHFLPNYTPLPAWQEGTPSHLRDPPPSAVLSVQATAVPSALKGFGSDSRGGGGGGAGSFGDGSRAETPVEGGARTGFVSLDKFFESGESEESGSEEESEEESEDDSEEEETSEEEDESEDGSGEEDELVRPSTAGQATW